MALSQVLKNSLCLKTVMKSAISCHAALQMRNLHQTNLLQCKSGCGKKKTCAKKPKELMSPECKVAIITGGTTGMGLSAACYLLSAGAKHVILTGLDQDVGECAVKELEEKHGCNKVTFVCGDVNDECHFEEVFELACKEHGGADILFNNAGMLNDKEWELEVDTNLKAMIRGTFLAFKYMGKDNGGKGGLVINNSSITGLQSLAGAPVYSTTKHGVLGIARNFGADFHYNRTCIRVVSLLPGVTITELVTGAAGKQYNEEWGKEAARELKSLRPQGVEVMGKAVVYLTRFAPSASVWVVEDSKIFLVELPDRHCISTLVEDLKSC